jgi:hypothetical protein
MIRSSVHSGTGGRLSVKRSRSVGDVNEMLCEKDLLTHDVQTLAGVLEAVSTHSAQ